MKIRISDLPAQGLEVKTTMALEPLNERLKQGENHGILFTQEPQVEIVVTKSSTGAETKGFVRSRYKQPCSRCMVEVDREIELEANFILQPKPEDLMELGEEEISDIGIVYFEGEHVDLEDVFQESLILALSIFWSPPSDAKGNCSICSLSEKEIKKKLQAGDSTHAGKVSLGDLFKKAGVK